MKKIISIVIAASMTCSIIAPANNVLAAETGTIVLRDDFSDNNLNGYEVYDPFSGESPDLTTNNGELRFSEKTGWNNNNGIKKNITSLLSDAGFKSGNTIMISAEISSSWYDNPAVLFVEVDNKRTELVCSGPSGQTWSTYTLAGSAAINLNEGEEVYFGITQPCGEHAYDNIVVSFESTTITATTEPTTVPTMAPEGLLLNDTFADGQNGNYSVYNSTDTTAVLTPEDGLLAVQFGNDWSANNGIKKNVTEIVKEYGTAKYEVSANAYTSWWGDTKAKLFFEVVSGDKSEIVIINEALGNSDSGSVELKGTVDLHFGENDTVYLCITQAAGYQNYDNILLRYTGEADPEPTADPNVTPEPMKTPEPTMAPLENVIFEDDFSDEEQLANYSLYDTNNLSSGAGIGISDGEMTASMGSSDWSWTNGIRRDITDLVKEYISGMNFGVQMDVSAYWGDTKDVNGNVFFETVGINGEVTTTDITTVIPSNGEQCATAFGTAQLNYKDDDKIYLCVTQPSGNHRYDNIAMWLETGNSKSIPLTSGKKYMGQYFPETAVAIYNDTFTGDSSEDIAARYTSYKDVEFLTEPVPNDGGVLFQFVGGGDEIRGVKVDVTEEFDTKLPNGGMVRVSCKMLPWWWWSTASIKLMVGDKQMKVATYASKSDDPSGVWATIGDIVDVEREKGERVEIIITMDTSIANGFSIDDVKVEIPYECVMARDIAVSNASELENISSVNIVYGDEFITNAEVIWGEQVGNVVYGKTNVKGVDTRAVIADSAVKVTVNSNGITAESIELEYGRRIDAVKDDEMVFLIDDCENMNLISAVSGNGKYSVPATGTTDVNSPISVRDNGNGITVEGTATAAVCNDKIIIIKNALNELVAAEYVRVDENGKYLVNSGKLATGHYSATMTDIGVSTEFSYASESEFEELRRRINSGEDMSLLLSDDTNRIILGAKSYAQFDKLSNESVSKIYKEFFKELKNKNRAEAADLFDALVTIHATESVVSEAEWTSMIEYEAKTLGIYASNTYEQYKVLSASERNEVKKKVYAQNLSEIEGFRETFDVAVLNTRLVNAGQYSNIQSILKENSELFEGTDVSVKNISASVAKYINKNISSQDMSIEEIASLIEEAQNSVNSSESTGSSGGSGSSGGGNGSGGIKGTNIGLTVTPPLNKPTSSGNTVKKVSFNDLLGFEWAQEAINSLGVKGILNGYGDGGFKPGNSITREEFVKVIVSAFEIPYTEETIMFDDVTEDAWSREDINAAFSAGLVTGISDKEFNPKANITRQDAAVIIYRTLKYKGIELEVGLNSFTDSNDISDYAVEEVSALSKKGIITGMDDGSFAPFGLTSRAQTAVMIYRVMNTLF